MEKEKVNKNGIIRNDICTGIVSLIKDVPKDVDMGGKVLDTSSTRKIVALNVRKICFEENGLYGEDLFYKASYKVPYTYCLLLPSVEKVDILKNNTLIIRDAKRIGAILEYAGFPSHIKSKDLKELTKIVMSTGDVLKIKAHSVTLGAEGIKNVTNNNVIYINEQASTLREFRHMPLPSRPQEIEKVYYKHFK